MNIPVKGLINFLSGVDNYAEATTQVVIIQTHASIVAVCDSYVYKIKKPVNFEFLDFSTLEKRKFFCEEEVRLNRRLAKGVYLEVQPIYIDGEILSFNVTGKVADYAIKMHRMSNEGFLSYLIQNDLDGPKHYKLISVRLTDFYKKLGRQQLNRDYGTKKSIEYIINENRIIRERFLDKTLHRLQESFISAYQSNFLKINDDLIANRVSEGWIRDVHGDLRLEHFHFDEEELNIYDCIEFKERLRVNDVVNDLAFLSMELEYEGRSQESARLFGDIAKRINDQPNYELWRFYKTHRACVRGMVHAVTGFESEVSEKDQKWNKKKSKNLFGLATRYVLLKDKPTVMVVFGGTATGKSTIASYLSELLNIPLVQSDVTRKELAGIPVDQYPDEETRKWLYTDKMTKNTYAEMIAIGKVALGKYNAVILDSRWAGEEQRAMVKESFHGSSLHWIKVEADLGTRKKRLTVREGHDSISDARLEVLDQLLLSEKQLEKQRPSVTLDTSHNIDECIEKVFQYFSKAGF